MEPCIRWFDQGSAEEWALAVVNCGDATARLRTGDRVIVDGTRGEVQVLGRGERRPTGGAR